MNTSHTLDHAASIPPFSGRHPRPASAPLVIPRPASYSSQTTRSGRRLPLSAAIAAMCRECIYDERAAGHFREQVAACACMRCPLWAVRPINRAAPGWLASRDPAQLPEGFASAAQADAVALVRGSRS